MDAITPTEQTQRTRRRARNVRVPAAFVALGLTLSVTVRVLAHDPGLSSLAVDVSPGEVSAVLSLAAADAEMLGGLAAVGMVALESIQVGVDGRALRGVIDRISMDETETVHVRLLFADASGARLVVKSGIAPRLSRGHRELVSIRAEDGTSLAEAMLDMRSNEVTANIAEPTGDRGARVLRFVALGMRHILTGWDHLLFLAALLVVVRRWRDVIHTITAFTLAHSVTLALAATGLVRAPGRIVEPLIAASVVYVGLENIFRSIPSSRWRLTFAFGLVHGLGFAAALRDLGVGPSAAAVALPLASFNVGVEAGQIAVAGVLVPIFWKLNARPDVRLRFASAWSVLVVLAGSYWLIERVL